MTVIGRFTKKHALNVFQRNVQNALQLDSPDKPHDYVLMILERPTWMIFKFQLRRQTCLNHFNLTVSQHGLQVIPTSNHSHNVLLHFPNSHANTCRTNLIHCQLVQICKMDIKKLDFSYFASGK